MAKISTHPTLFDSVLQMNITKLKEWGYLKPNHFGKYHLIWNRRGNEIGRISIVIKITDDNAYVKVDYLHNQKPITYKIELVSKPSNLGKGIMWFFRCPKTKKLCRKLYCIDGYFLHREAFKGCFYETQTQSKQLRETEKLFKIAFGDDKAYDELYSKHFKKYYNGRPTKRYKRIIKKINDAENFPLEILQSIK